MSVFEKTPRAVIEEALTRGNSLPFDTETLQRMKEQERQFSKPLTVFPKPLTVGLSIIPLAIIAYLVLK